MSDNNLINGNYIGTDYNGASAKPNKPHGVFVSCLGSLPAPGTPQCPPSNNVIRVNLISGNSQDGVVIDATNFSDPIISNWAERTYNQVIGNFIGTNATGTALVPNGMCGVLIQNASFNYIGSDAALNVFGNVIGGNFYGVCIEGSQDGGGLFVSGNRVLGNYIGTNQTGAAALASSGAGSPNLGNGQQGVNLGGFHGPVINGEIGGDFVTNNLQGGILKTTGALGVSIHDNVALGNAGYDLEEDNSPPSCGNNIWANNTFKVAAGTGTSCIH
jgi:titin